MGGYNAVVVAKNWSSIREKVDGLPPYAVLYPGAFYRTWLQDFEDYYQSKEGDGSIPPTVTTSERQQRDRR
jgi:hypothetical protein